MVAQGHTENCPVFPQVFPPSLVPALPSLPSFPRGSWSPPSTWICLTRAPTEFQSPREELGSLSTKLTFVLSKEKSPTLGPWWQLSILAISRDLPSARDIDYRLFARTIWRIQGFNQGSFLHALHSNHAKQFSFEKCWSALDLWSCKRFKNNTHTYESINTSFRNNHVDRSTQDHKRLKKLGLQKVLLETENCH